MENSKYLADLKDIKDLMNKSSKFISLSGWSGISIGIVALIAAYIAHIIIYETKTNTYAYSTYELFNPVFFKLTFLALATLTVSIVLGIIFTYNKSKKTGQKIWTSQSKILLANLAIPLIIGGCCCIALIYKGYFVIIAPLTLIFYGLSLINASKFTLHEIKSLGIANSILGIIGLYFSGYGLLLWAVGFGILHIVYGVIMKVKHG